MSNKVMLPGSKRKPEANYRPILRMVKESRLEFNGVMLMDLN